MNVPRAKPIHFKSKTEVFVLDVINFVRLIIKV